ncbi:MAG TPA: tetratricopeptide repeat protein, partial [Herpetosiphonaceae bacterium]
PGGIGKTRLALQAARAAAEAGWFRDGVWFADLTAVGSAEFLAAALCRAVGQPCPPGDDPEQRLAAFVRGKELALVLDNFEQLIEQGAPLVARLLAAGGGLRLLVTSRQCLDLAEEWLIEVGGLGYPAAGERGDGSHSAVALFAARARQALGSFAPAPGGEEWLAIDRICQLVEGMPLGIELAAAWVKTLPCAQILAEIQQNIDFLGGGRRNQPDRHRGLRAVFEHSWRLLADQEQRALAQLGVFRGPFSREAALQVTQAELRVIAALIDKSLVRRSRDGGYSLHELLRQYAAEKLWAEPATEEAVRGRHARYYALFAQQQHGRWDGQQEESARLQLQTELPNICDGWRWAGAGGQPAVLELCLEPLYDLYLATHLCQEGLALFEQAAESPAAAGAPLLRARLLARQAQFCYELGRFDHGRERLRAALALREGTPPDHAELALAYELLGLIAHQQGDPAAARPLLAEAAAHARRTGDHARAAHIQLSTGSVAIALRDYPAASAALDESLMIYQRLDKQWGVGHALRFLGMVAQAEGEAGRARELYQRSLLLFQEIGNVPGETLVLLYLGDACAGDSAASRPADAGYYYRRAFELAAASQSTPMLLRVALSVSRLLAGADQPGGAPRELAFLLAGLVVSHAGAGPALKQQAREVQAALAASLPPRLIDDLRRQAAGLRLEDALARAGDLALPEQAAPAVLALGAG